MQFLHELLEIAGEVVSKGQHSVRIKDHWRICFVWRDGEAHDVEVTDYHRLSSLTDGPLPKVKGRKP